VLDDPRYRSAATAAARQIREAGGVDVLLAEVERLQSGEISRSGLPVRPSGRQGQP
jgi:hypothetical protein